MIVVHILEHGSTLCGFRYPLLPVDWPEGHKWIGRDEAETATCARCRIKAGLPTTTQHWLERIDEVYVVLASNEEGEGVVGALIGGVQFPLMAADASRLKNIIPLAKMVAQQTGRTFQLVKFTTREVVEEIKP